MLSAVVLVADADPATGRRPLVPMLRTLAALVPATVEGLVRDVTLLCVGDAGDAAKVADEAGCRLAEAPGFGAALERSLSGTRGPWICLLQPGTLPGRTFAEDVSAALEETTTPPQALLLRGEGRRLARLFPPWSAVTGVIVPRDRLAGRPCGSFGEILRRARPARALTGRLARVA